MFEEQFPDTHPVTALRGRRRLSPTRCRQALLQRSLWLQKRIEEREDAGQSVGFCYDELAAVEQALEVLGGTPICGEP